MRQYISRQGGYQQRRFTSNYYNNFNSNRGGGYSRGGGYRSRGGYQQRRGGGFNGGGGRGGPRGGKFFPRQERQQVQYRRIYKQDNQQIFQRRNSFNRNNSFNNRKNSYQQRDNRPMNGRNRGFIKRTGYVRKQPKDEVGLDSQLDKYWNKKKGEGENGAGTEANGENKFQARLDNQLNKYWSKSTNTKKSVELIEKKPEANENAEKPAEEANHVNGIKQEATTNKPSTQTDDKEAPL